MFPNSDQNEGIRKEKQEEGAHAHEAAVGSNSKLKLVSICASKIYNPGEVTIKAVYYIRTTKGQIYNKRKLRHSMDDTCNPSNNYKQNASLRAHDVQVVKRLTDCCVPVKCHGCE
jgi:hypothetical protein